MNTKSRAAPGRSSKVAAYGHYDRRVDTVAATGFAAGADAYEDARPSWPLKAIDAAFEHWQLEPSGGPVVDLAAGTGRLTAQLAKRCPHLVAVEPVAEMRAHIRAAEAVAGTAERIPLGDASAQAVFVAEAFHWFDYPTALGEIARVLLPGGGLAVMWNNAIQDDEQTRLRAALRDLLAEHVYHPKGIDRLTSDPRQDRDWRTGPGWELFEPLEHREFFHERETTRADVVRLIGSWSFIGALDEPTRADVLRQVEQLLAESGVEKYLQRWRCDLYLTRRR
jgi:ubiquinone/menaquinone biosynthesis C-methylase UbiE